MIILINGSLGVVIETDELSVGDVVEVILGYCGG
jgi:hypothetical protein